MNIKMYGKLQKELLCRQENDNYHALFSVAVVKDDHIVGHV